MARILVIYMIYILVIYMIYIDDRRYGMVHGVARIAYAYVVGGSLHEMVWIGDGREMTEDDESS